MYRDEEKIFDIRVLDKHFPADDASRKQIFTYLDSLPDVSSKIDTDYLFDFTSLPSASKNEPDEVVEDTNEALLESDSSDVNS